MINFDYCPACYWSEQTRITYLQRRIIVASICYYEFDKSPITDRQYDELCKQLVRMQSEASNDVLKKTMYFNIFYDFDGSTGFDLASRLSLKDYNYLLNIAGEIIKNKTIC